MGSVNIHVGEISRVGLMHVHIALVERRPTEGADRGKEMRGGWVGGAPAEEVVVEGVVEAALLRRALAELKMIGGKHSAGEGKRTCHINGKLLILTRTRSRPRSRTRPTTLGGKNASSRDMTIPGEMSRSRDVTTLARLPSRSVLKAPAIICDCCAWLCV